VIASLDIELCDCFFDYGEASAEMFLLLTFVAFGVSLIWIGFAAIDARTLAFALIALAMRTAVLLPGLKPAGISDSSRRLIAWFGPRGLSTLLLVLLAVFAGIPEAERLFSVACLVVLLSVVLHGGGIALLLRRRTDVLAAPAGERALSRAPLPVVEHPPRSAESSPKTMPERITTTEVRELLARGEPVTLVDVRTDRTYRNDSLRAKGAVRLPPEDVVRSARQLRLEQRATLVVYCA
jgi:NhaP-type Na+/H+ and K+/H+ antiporter